MTQLNLTVLACEAGRSSGYLLQSGRSTVLVDCGPGVIRTAEKYLEPSRLDGVVITHEHADHSLDLVGLAFRLRYPTPHGKRIPLYVPPGMTRVLDRLDELFGAPTIGQLECPIHDSFAITTLNLDGRNAIDVGPGLSMTAFPARHAVPSAALRFETLTGTVAFSSDTGPTDSVADAARGVDLFVCEATYGAAAAPTDDPHGHLTAAQAGQLARQAGVRELVLTHLPSVDAAVPSRRAAAREYPGEVQVAARNRRFPCGANPAVATG